MPELAKKGLHQPPVLLFATPPPLEQLAALTIHISDASICSQAASKLQPQVIKCREFIFTEPEVIGTPSADIKDWSFCLIAQVSVIKSGRLQSRLARVGLQVSKPHHVTTELYQSCLRYTLTARLSPAWNKAGPWLVQGRDFLINHGCANAVKLDLTVNQNELYFTLEATALKLAPLQVTDLDILGRKLQEFLTRPGVEIDHDSIASDWCFVLPSMKRGRIVSISHEIPEDTPFVTYRDLKRHWKNTYGYRLPEDEDGVIYYQVHFGPLGGRLFTYPEMCLRAREMQRVARVDPKPILRKFIQEVQTKFPTICGQPVKLQSKAKFTFPDLLESGQINPTYPANLTGKMSGMKPILYRTQSEMDNLKNISIKQPIRNKLSASLSQIPSTSAEKNSKSNENSVTSHVNSLQLGSLQKINSHMKRLSSSQQNINSQLSRPPSSQQNVNSQLSRPPSSQQNINPQLNRPPSSKQSVSSQLSRPPSSQQNINPQLNRPPSSKQNVNSQLSRPPSSQLNRPSSSKQNISSQLSMPLSSQQNISSTCPGGSTPVGSFAKNGKSPGDARQTNAETPSHSTTVSGSQAQVARKLFPWFKPKKNLMSQFHACSQPKAAAAGPKVVPVFRTQSLKSIDMISAATTSKPRLLGANVVSGKTVTRKATLATEGTAIKRERQKQKPDKAEAKRRKLQQAED